MTESYARTAPVITALPRPRPASRAPREPALTRLAFFFFWCLVFTIPWENLVVIPNLGTVAHLVGYLAVCLGLLAVLDKGRLQAVTGGFLLLALFTLWRCLTFIWTDSPESTLIEMQTILQMVAMVWLLHQIAFSQGRLLSVIQAYVLGTMVSSVDTIYQYLQGVNLKGQSRFWAVGFDPNELALMLVLSIPMSLYLAAIARKQRMVWLYRLQLVLTASAVLLTASRGPFLSSLGVLVFLPAVFFRAGEKQKTALAAVAALGGAVIVFLVPAASWKRLGSIGSEISTGTLNDRRTIWEAGLETFRHHYVIGVGAGSFHTAVHTGTGVAYVAHNTFLSIAVEMGLIGFALYLALYLYSIRSCLRMPSFERSLWLSVLLVMTIGTFSLTWEYRKPIWLIFGLISLQVCVGRQARKLVPRRLSRFAAPGFAPVGVMAPATAAAED